ncbi:MAG: hypothetical protein HYX32_15340 [Actinobacteria bacterium]|nr:hypothetical protein [Actinomycetota bacterium]
MRTDRPRPARTCDMQPARMRRRAVLAVLLITVAGVPVLASQASAAPVPVVNPPVGGGPVVSQAFETTTFEVGPMGSGNDSASGSGLVPRPSGAFGLKSISFDLVDEQGNSLDPMAVMLHHFVIGRVNSQDTACPGHRVGGFPVEPLVGTGMERTPIDFQDPYALLVGASDTWGGVWEFMNQTDQTLRFKIKYTIGVQPGASSLNTRGVTPYWAGAVGCPGTKTWDVPGDGGPGGVATRSWDWTMPADGVIVGIGGHMHDGGIDMVTKHEDGTVICTNTANYDMGMLMSIDRCPLHESVQAGEKLRVTTRYDNSQPHNDVMSAAVVFIWFGTQGTGVADNTYRQVPPARLLDTRQPGSVPIGPQQTVAVKVTGVAGVPDSNVDSVVVNLTAVNPSQNTHLTAYRSGSTRPGSSNVNAAAGQTVANLAIVPVGSGGEITIFNNAGTTNAIVDIEGWYGSAEPAGDRFSPVPPARLLDTRSAGGAVGPGETRTIQVAGVAAAPASGVSAALVNLTATDVTGATHVVAWATGETMPPTSNLNVVAGQTAANLAVVPVGADGSFTVVNNSASTELIVDLQGWYGPTAANRYGSVSPARVFDSRFGIGGPASVLGPGSTRTVQVAGVGDVPATGAQAVVVNLTGTGVTGATHVVAWATGTPMPPTSNLNLEAGQTAANLAVVPVGGDGSITIRNQSATDQVIVDVQGWYG